MDFLRYAYALQRPTRLFNLGIRNDRAVPFQHRHAYPTSVLYGPVYVYFQNVPVDQMYEDDDR